MRRSTLLLIVHIALIASPLPASSATRHVVMLFDERLEFPGLATLEAEFVRTLTANYPDRIETYREPMDLSRFDSEAYRTLLKDYLRAKYANKKIDVAVAVFGPALEFLLKHGDAILPGTPIVFCGIEKEELSGRSLPPHVRGVLLSREFAPTLELALNLHPLTEQVVVVAGTSEFDTRLLNWARQDFSAYESRLTFTYLTTLPLQKLLTELAGLPPHTIVLLTTLFRDGAGESFVPHNVVPLVSDAASAPVYGFLDQYLGRGIVGGSLYSSSTQGMEAAKLVLQVLDGSERSRPSFLEPSSNKVMFDWRQTQRWGISESRLPPGSEILFRPVTAWEQYRWQILLMAAVVFTETVLIMGLLYEHQRRRRAEVQSSRRMTELAHLNRVATAGELSASIAHEVKQPLTVIVAQSSAALRWLARTTPDLNEARAALKQIMSAGNRASEIVDNLRSMFRKESSGRRPLDINALLASVIELTSHEAKKHGILVHTTFFDGQKPQTLGDQAQLEQVFLNLVMNAIEAMSSSKSNPRVLELATSVEEDDEVLVTVADNGAGVDAESLEKIFDAFFTTKPNGMGMGLSICKTIIEAHEGSLTAVPNKPHGMEFRIVLPIAA
jgi:signal transduction histidine kinase